MEGEEDTGLSLHQQPPWQQWLEEAERRLAHVPTVTSYGRRMAVCSDVKEALFLWCPIPGCPSMLSALKHQFGYPATEAAMHPCTQLEQLMFLKQFIAVTPGTLLVDMAALKSRQDLFLLYKQVKARHENVKHPLVKLCMATHGKLAPLYYTKTVSKDLTKKKYLPAVVRTEPGKVMSTEGENWSILNKDGIPGKMKFKRGKGQEEISNQTNLAVSQKSSQDEKQMQLGGPMIESVIYNVKDAVSNEALVPLSLLRDALPAGQAFLEDVARLYLLGRCWAGAGLASVTTCLTAEALQLTRFLASHKGYDEPWSCLTSCSLMMSWAEFHSGFARLRPNSVKLLPMTNDLSVVTLACEDIKKVMPEQRAVSNSLHPHKPSSSTTIVKPLPDPAKPSKPTTLQKPQKPLEGSVWNDISTQNEACSKQDKDTRNKMDAERQETLNRDVNQQTCYSAMQVQTTDAQNCKNKTSAINCFNKEDTGNGNNQTKKIGPNKTETNKKKAIPDSTEDDPTVGTREIIQIKKTRSRCSVRITRSNTKNASKSNENFKCQAEKPQKITKDDANNSAIEDDEDKTTAKQANQCARTAGIKPKQKFYFKGNGGSEKQEMQLVKQQRNELEKDKIQNTTELSPDSTEASNTLKRNSGKTSDCDKIGKYASVATGYDMRKGLLSTPKKSDVRPYSTEKQVLLPLSFRIKSQEPNKSVADMIYQAAAGTEMTSLPDSSGGENKLTYVNVIPKQLRLKTPPAKSKPKPRVSSKRLPHKSVRNVNELAKIKGAVTLKIQDDNKRVSSRMCDPTTLEITSGGAANKQNTAEKTCVPMSLPGPLHPILTKPVSGSTSVKLPDEIVTTLKEQASRRSPFGNPDALYRELQGGETLAKKSDTNKLRKEDSNITDFQTERIALWKDVTKHTGENKSNQGGRSCKSAEVARTQEKGYIYRPNSSSIYSHTETGYQTKNSPCFKASLCSVFSRQANEAKQKCNTANLSTKSSKQKGPVQPESCPNYGSSSSTTPDIYDKFARRRRSKISSNTSQAKGKPIAYVPKHLQVSQNQSITDSMQHRVERRLQQATQQTNQPATQQTNQPVPLNYHTVGYSTSQEAIEHRASLEKMSQGADPFQQKYVHVNSQFMNLPLATMLQTNCKMLDPPPTRCPSCFICRHLAETLLSKESSATDLSPIHSQSLIKSSTETVAADEGCQLATTASDSFNTAYKQMRLLQKVNSFVGNCTSPEPSGSLESVETIKSIMSRDFTSDLSVASNRGKDCLVETCKTDYYPFKHGKDCTKLEDEFEIHSGEKIARLNSQLYFTVPGQEGLVKIEGDITIPANAEFYVQKEEEELMQALSSYSGTSLTGCESSTFLKKLRRLKDESSNEIETIKNSEYLLNANKEALQRSSEFQPDKTDSDVAERTSTEVEKDVDEISTAKDSELIVSETSQLVLYNRSEASVRSADEDSTEKSSSNEEVSAKEATPENGETVSDKQGPLKSISPTLSKTTCNTSTSKQAFQDFVEENRASKKNSEFDIPKKKFWASAQVKYLKDCQTSSESSNYLKLGKVEQKLALKPAIKTLKDTSNDAPNLAKDKSKTSQLKQNSSSTTLAVKRKPRPKTSPTKRKVKTQDVKQRPKTGSHRSRQKHRVIRKDKSMSKLTPIENDKSLSKVNQIKNDTVEVEIKNTDAYTHYRDSSCTTKTKTSQNQEGSKKPKILRSTKSVKRAKKVLSRYKCKTRQESGDTFPVETALKRLSIEENLETSNSKNEACRHRLRSIVQAELDRSPSKWQSFQSSADELSNQIYLYNLINLNDSQSKLHVKKEPTSPSDEQIVKSQQDQHVRNTLITQMNQNAILDDQDTPAEFFNQNNTTQPCNSLTDSIVCLNSNKNNVAYAENEVNSDSYMRDTCHQLGIEKTTSIRACKVPSPNYIAAVIKQVHESCNYAEPNAGPSENLVVLQDHSEEVEPAPQMNDNQNNGETVMMFQHIVDADGVEWLQLTGPDGSVYHIAKQDQNYASLVQFYEEQQHQYVPEYNQSDRQNHNNYWNDECNAEDFVIVANGQNENAEHLENMQHDNGQYFATRYNVAQPECVYGANVAESKMSELHVGQESQYIHFKQELVNDQSELKGLYHDCCNRNIENQELFTTEDPNLGNYAEELCKDECANGCDHLPTVEIDRDEEVLYTPARYTDEVDHFNMENVYMFNDGTDSVNEVTVDAGNEHESNNQFVSCERGTENANVQMENENDCRPNDTLGNIRNIKQETLDSTTNSHNSCIGPETRQYDKTEYLHCTEEAKKSISSATQKKVFKDTFTKVKQFSPSATHNDKTKMAARPSNSDPGLVRDNRQKISNSDRSDNAKEAGNIVESSSDQATDSDLDYEADEDDDRDEDYVPENSDENIAASYNEAIGDIGDIYDDVRIINQSLGKTETSGKPTAKKRKSLKSMKCKKSQVKSKDKSLKRKSIKNKRGRKSKQMPLNPEATEIFEHNKSCLDERKETSCPENDSDNSSAKEEEEVDKNPQGDSKKKKPRKTKSKIRRKRKTLLKNVPGEKNDEADEDRAAESFIQKQKIYMDIIKHSSLGQSTSEPALDDSVREEPQQADIVKEVPTGIPVHGERVISKALADAEKALEGTGSLSDDHEPAVIQDQAHRCTIVADTLIYGSPQANRVDPDETAPTGAVSSGSTLCANTSNHVTMSYQLVEDEDHINLGGIAYIRNFSLPFVYINGYKYVPLRDALTLFQPGHCVSNCTIPRNVLQKNKKIVKSFSTWDQVYKFELIKMKKGPPIMTGDTVIKLDSLLDTLPDVVMEVVALHRDTKLKRSQKCDVNSYKNF